MRDYSFRSMLDDIHRSPLYRHPTSFLWRESLSVYSQFCKAVVETGMLTWEEMIHAASQYCIGASRKQGVIFWQIDRDGRVHDGKVMYYQPDCHRKKDCNPTWVSFLLARRHHFSKDSWSPSHCFFGLHLTSSFYRHDFSETTPIAIVEAEKTAFVLSERYPQYIWLAAGGMGEVQPCKFRPLRGRRIVMFPDTDTDGIAFRRWTAAAKTVMESSFWEDSPPIRVSPLLELHATPDQKQRKIDLLDYRFEK
jgi:hypothetical protein